MLGFVDSQLRGAAIGPGYSGGPLWCEDVGAAVGIVLGVMEPPPGSFGSDQVVRRTIVIRGAKESADSDSQGQEAAAGYADVPGRRGLCSGV